MVNDLRQSGVALYDAVVDGAILRLRPVLMTMLVEVLGGLLSATVLTLLILPLMYHVWERRAELKARPDNDRTHFSNKEGELMMWNRRFDVMSANGRIRVLVLLLVMVPWLWSCGSVVSPGQLGLKWRPATTGLSKQPLREGFYMHMPWNDVLTISYRWQSFSEPVSALTRDDLHIRLDASVIIRPIAEELYQLQVDIGPDFYPRIVQPEFLTVTRSVIAEYAMTEVPESSPEIETKILVALRERLTGKHLEANNVTINHIDFSAGMLRAIEAKLAKEQEQIQKTFELEIASKDAEIARVRAKGEGDSLRIKASGQAEAQKIRAAGQAEAQKLIAETLTARFLQFKAFDSPNTKFIYVPTGKDGLPIIVSPEVK